MHLIIVDDQGYRTGHPIRLDGLDLLSERCRNRLGIEVLTELLHLMRDKKDGRRREHRLLVLKAIKMTEPKQELVT